MATEAEFQRIIDAEPNLCCCGFASQLLRRKSQQLSGDGFAKDRERLRETCFREFSDSVEFLSRCQLQRTPNPKRAGFSYHLKHAAGRYADNYISNGALIAAAIYLEIPLQPIGDDNPNAHLAISSKCPVATEKALKDQRRLAQSKAWDD